MRKNKWLWLLMFILLVALTTILILEQITYATFISISGIWIIMFFLYMVGFELIQNENWSSFYKKGIRAAKEIREEIEGK